MEKSLNIINKFNTKELIDLLEKNGYAGFEEVFKRQNVTGQYFLSLSEFEISRWKLPIALKNRLWLCLTSLQKDPQSFLNKTTTTIKPQVATIRPRIVQNRPIQIELENVIRNQSENRQNHPPKRPPKPRLPSPPPPPPPSYLPMEKSNLDQVINYDEHGYLLPSDQLNDDKQGKKFVSIAQRSPMVLPRDPPSDVEHDYVDDSEIGGVEETYEPAPISSPPPPVEEIKNEIDGGTLSKFVSLFKRFQEQKSSNIYVNQAMKSESPTFKRHDLDQIPINDIRLRPLPPLPTTTTDSGGVQEESKEVEIIYENNENNVEKKLPLPPVNWPQITPIDYQNTENRPEADSLPPMMLEDNSDDADDLEDYDQCVFNLNDEPFYRNTDRKGAKLLLKDLHDGAFVFRPSKRYFLTLTIKFGGKFFNLGIERTTNNKIRCESNGSSTPPEFATLNDFIKYFTRNPLTFQSQTSVVEVFLEKQLTDDLF